MRKETQPSITGTQWRRFFRRFFWSFVVAYLFAFLFPHFCGITPRYPRYQYVAQPEYYDLQSTWKWAIPIAFVAAIWFCWRMESQDK
jgi:hypothetical protein